MKTVLVAMASLATLASPIVASAHPYSQGGGWNDRGSQNGGYERSQGRSAYGQGYDQRRGGSYAGSNYRDSYRTDNGAGTAIFAGIAGLLLGSAISGSQSHNYSQSYGYSQPYSQPYGAYPSYDQGYGYSPSYSYAPTYSRGW